MEVETLLKPMPSDQNTIFAIAFPNAVEVKSYITVCVLKNMAFNGYCEAKTASQRWQASMYNCFRVCNVVLDKRYRTRCAPSAPIDKVNIEPNEVYNPHVLYFTSRAVTPSSHKWFTELQEEACSNHLTTTYFNSRRASHMSQCTNIKTTINLTPYKGRKYYYTDRQNVTHIANNIDDLLGYLAGILDYTFSPRHPTCTVSVAIDEPIADFLSKEV